MSREQHSGIRQIGAFQEREINGRRFPTMSFRMIIPRLRTVADGLFVLYFPDDYNARRKFCVLMWEDVHPENESGTGSAALDTIVASAKVKP